MSNANINAVFYADTYHPIQAGSIDGTDTLPHDNAVYRAVLCSAASLCEWLQLLYLLPLSLRFVFVSPRRCDSWLIWYLSDDPFGDPKVIGDPYCTVFVGRLSRLTDEESLRKV
ncbi:hypothetical protein GW17_00030674 [Ensete ventricosum]|nr:hypothetical protein GW17_00030674 [Ensete ventricosum]